MPPKKGAPKRSSAKSKPKKKSRQATLRSKKFGRQVLKASARQTGKSHTKRDEGRKAMQPGKRRSASGRIYHEYRKNRSDLRGKKV